MAGAAAPRLPDVSDAIVARPPGATSKAPFWPSLDGYRGFFVLFVFAAHVHRPWLLGATITVDGFFVLSGFLITYLIVREHRGSGRVDLRLFYIRRALRLLPVAFASVAFGIAMVYLAIPDRRDDVWPAARSVLLYYANFRAAEQPERMAVFLPTWSLSTEEQFYVVWPLLLVAMLALGLSARMILAFTATTLVAATCWLQLAYERGAPLAHLIYRPDLRISGILVGCVTGLLYSFELLPSSGVLRRWLPPLTYGALAFNALYILEPELVPTRFVATLAVVAACVGWAFLFVQQVTAPLAPVSFVLDRVVFRWLGRMSYTLYLVHVPVIRAVRSTWDLSPVALLVASFVPTLLVTMALHYGVERPFLRLKDRLEPPSRRSVA